VWLHSIIQIFLNYYQCQHVSVESNAGLLTHMATFNNSNILKLLPMWTCQHRVWCRCPYQCIIYHKKLKFFNNPLAFFLVKKEGTYSRCGNYRLPSSTDGLVQTQSRTITTKKARPTIRSSRTSFQNLLNSAKNQRKNANFDGSLVLKGKNRTWQLPLEQAVEEVKKREEMSGKRKNMVVVSALHFER